jgi:hypothetical protein
MANLVEVIPPEPQEVVYRFDVPHKQAVVLAALSFLYEHGHEGACGTGLLDGSDFFNNCPVDVKHEARDVAKVLRPRDF